jgi:hypothetical protein
MEEPQLQGFVNGVRQRPPALHTIIFLQKPHKRFPG